MEFALLVNKFKDVLGGIEIIGWKIKTFDVMKLYMYIG